MSKGFNCECGKHHVYTSYIYVRPHEELIHTCSCRRKHVIVMFEAYLCDKNGKIIDKARLKK